MFENVAPLVGAWIEMPMVQNVPILPTLSLPLWERGLKCCYPYRVWLDLVAPLVGAWIEIPSNVEKGYDLTVAPLVGAWIEINCKVGS